MKPLALWLIMLAFCIQCTETGSPPNADKATETTGSAPVVQIQKKTEPVATSASNIQKAYVDPQTGELISKPKQDTRSASGAIEPSSMNTSTEELEEQSSTVPGGGVMIDLKGNFRNPLKATINENGKASIEHRDTDKME